MTVKKSAATSADEKAIVNILNRVVESVHKLDYAGVRDLIPDDGMYFGSVTPVARGFQELYEQQFSKVWPNISEFKMVDESIALQVCGPLAWATSLFVSGGKGSDGELIQRKGRMTFVFERRDGNWVMVHSHDSLYPVPPGAAS